MTNRPLNEGRPGRAGNSSRPSCRPSHRIRAQRRPARTGRQLLKSTRSDCYEPPCRSTKAGPAGPATRGRPIPSRLRAASLNEGRPGRAGNSRSPCPRARPTGSALNEGRPGRAGNSCSGCSGCSCRCNAQRRPARPGRQLASITLSIPAKGSAAQRRPARPGRQLWISPSAAGLGDVRSTKAGPAGPATPVLPSSPCPERNRAQRRPARPGRQLGAAGSPTAGASPLNEGRPGRAGNSSELQIAVSVRVQRSTKAGPAGPATLRTWRASVGRLSVAQRRPARPGRQLTAAWTRPSPVRIAQRRPARPGRQLQPRQGRPQQRQGRSTKAGPAGPATLSPCGGGFVHEGMRSTKAGPAGPATRGGAAVFRGA